MFYFLKLSLIEFLNFLNFLKKKNPILDNEFFWLKIFKKINFFQQNKIFF